MAELEWYPHKPLEWLRNDALLSLTPEQELAYRRLYESAWGTGEHEPSLPTDDGALGHVSRLGRARWAKIKGPVVALLTERGGRYHIPGQADLWREQQDKHATTVKKAAAGGRARAEKMRALATQQDGQKSATSNTTGTASGMPQARHERAESDGKATGGTTTTPQLPLPAPSAAALGKARSAGALQRPESGDTKEDTNTAELRKRFYARAVHVCSEYEQNRPEEFTAIVQKVRVAFGIPHSTPSSDIKGKLAWVSVQAEILRALGLPTFEEWIEQRNQPIGGG